MKKDLETLYTTDKIQKIIKSLDRDKIHILYYNYSFNWHNFYKNPLLVFTKIYNLFTGRPSIDHVNHISRFRFDEHRKVWDARVFEATMERGMEENDLFDKLKLFRGTCYIETLDIIVDKVKAKEFENTYTGVPYSKKVAVLSALKCIDIKGAMIGGSCSWLEVLFMKGQGLNLSKLSGGDESKITPADLFSAELGVKSILFKN